jgi:predicted phosphodiesterase
MPREVKSWSPERASVVIRVLNRHYGFTDAMEEVARVLGPGVTADAMRGAFKRLGFKNPSSYLKHHKLPKYVTESVMNRCTEHTDYVANELPTTRCTICWDMHDLWLSQQVPNPQPIKQEDSSVITDGSPVQSVQAPVPHEQTDEPKSVPLPEDMQAKTTTGVQGGYIVVFASDTHGATVDPRAWEAYARDLAVLRPQLLVKGGDSVDVSGIFNQHQREYVRDLEYSLEADTDAANAQLDIEQRYAHEIMYLEGNHEHHLERWIARQMDNARDAQAMLEAIDIPTRLRLKERGVRYIRACDQHDGLTAAGVVRHGKCYFTHGYRTNKYATATIVEELRECVVHGHTHRAQYYVTRTLTSLAIAGWCPGTLSLLQPIWKHNFPTTWTHGYWLAFFEPDGRFIGLNVPIINGWSALRAMLATIRPEHFHGS